jgi:acylphosphatase
MGRVSDEIVRRRLIVQGRVQGVFFRDSTRHCARSAGVAGWARNRDDGTLEVVVEGPSDAVERVVRFCETGPRGARVESVDSQPESPEGLSGFEIC